MLLERLEVAGLPERTAAKLAEIAAAAERARDAAFAAEVVAQSGGRHRWFALRVARLGLTVVSAALFWSHTGTGAQGFQAKTITPFLGQGFRYGFGFLGLLASVAAVSATGAGTGPPCLRRIVSRT